MRQSEDDMRFIVNLLLLFIVFACKPLQRSGNELDSSLRSVTDGRMTLGVVPVSGSSGVDGYVLLLCKNSHSYSRSSFTDDRYCRPALLTSTGQQAVFIPDQMKGHDGSINYRSMVTKAAIFMGVAGIVVIGGKYALKALGKNVEKPLTFTRNLDRLAKSSGIDKEILDYSKAVKKLKDAETNGKKPEVIAKLTEAVAEKKAILDSAADVNMMMLSRRAMDAYASELGKLPESASASELKSALTKFLDAEKQKIFTRHERLEKAVHQDATDVVTEYYLKTVEHLDNEADNLVKFDANNANAEGIQEILKTDKPLLDEKINQALDNHAELLRARKFNFSSIEIDTSKIVDAVGYGAAGAGATLFLANTLAPNLFVKHPHGAAGDGTLRSHWQKVFIFQDYGFSQTHTIKSIDTLLRKIATELDLQVNPRISGW